MMECEKSENYLESDRDKKFEITATVAEDFVIAIQPSSWGIDFILGFNEARKGFSFS